jgi:hypothetical protein
MVVEVVKIHIIRQMQRSLLIAALAIMFLNAYCQQPTRFEYTHIKNSFYTSTSYLVSPTFDQSKLEGKEGKMIFLDQAYLNTLFNNAINLSISKDKRDSVSPGTIARFAINKKGEVIYCQFFLNFEDTLLITDEDLYNLYRRIKKIEIDITKFRIDPNYEYGHKDADYAIVIVGLISKESRDRFNKEIEERRKKRRLQNQAQTDSIKFQ